MTIFSLITSGHDVQCLESSVVLYEDGLLYIPLCPFTYSPNKCISLTKSLTTKNGITIGGGKSASIFLKNFLSDGPLRIYIGSCLDSYKVLNGVKMPSLMPRRDTYNSVCPRSNIMYDSHNIVLLYLLRLLDDDSHI